MKHSDFMRYVAVNTWTRYKDTKFMVETIFDLIKERLVKGDNVVISNFGKFDTVKILSRKWVNPKTLESIIIPDLIRTKFIPAKKFKHKLNIWKK